MKYKKETRYYSYLDEKGKEHYRKVNYVLWFDSDKLVDVRNEYNHSVEKTSECWEFFDTKYNT